MNFKLVMLPPQTPVTRQWAARITSAGTGARVVVAETRDDAAREIVDAEAAFGTLPADLLTTVSVSAHIDGFGPTSDHAR